MNWKDILKEEVSQKLIEYNKLHTEFMFGDKFEGEWTLPYFVNTDEKVNNQIDRELESINETYRQKRNMPKKEYVRRLKEIRKL